MYLEKNPWDKSVPKYLVDIVPDCDRLPTGLVVTQVAVFGFDNEHNRYDQILEVLDLFSPLRLAERIRMMRPNELKDFHKMADTGTSLVSRADMPGVHVLKREYFERV
jgi:hypothetical protein